MHEITKYYYYYLFISILFTSGGETFEQPHDGIQTTAFWDNEERG